VSLNGYVAIAAVLAVLLSPVLLLLSPIWVPWLLAQSRRGRGEGYRTLQPWMARTIELYAEAGIRGGPPPGGWQRVARILDDYLASIRSPRAWRPKMVVLLMEIAPLLVLRPRFSRLGAAERRAFLDRHVAGQRGLLRVAALGRQLVRLGYYSDPEVQAAMGFRVPDGAARPAGVLTA
jgi:hypothetical protein